MLIILTGISYTGKSQGSEPCPPESQLRKIYAAALQSVAKDTIIFDLEKRIEGFQNAIRERKIIDSLRIDGYKKDSIYSDSQKKLALDQISKLNRQLKWQKTKGDILGGTAGAILLYIVIQSIKK